jgi:phosphohistidine phosphatase
MRSTVLGSGKASATELKAGPKLLYVLRHAKSSWDDPTLDDHDRPLARRGRRDARRLGRHFISESIAPDLVLCSSSLRTRETLAVILPSLEGEVQLLVEDGLYGADAKTLLERLHEVPGAVASVMLIGHNPGLHELILELATPGPERDRLRENLSTAALVNLEVTTSWQRLEVHQQELVRFVVARNLSR